MHRRFFLFLVFVSSFFASGFVTSDSDIYFRIAKSIDIFGRVYKEVVTNYVDHINPEEFMLAGIKGMLNSLDPYTGYIGENQQGDIDLITTGKYGGVGATVGLQNDKIIVVDLLEGYSAQRQGIQIGDIIVRIDSVDVFKDNYEDLSIYLKGEPGSEVTIFIERDGEEENLIFILVREEIEVKNISYYGFVPEESNNAYLKLSGFSRSAGEEIKKAIFDLGEQREVESIVLDLRGNPGGLLEAAIDVSEKFLQKGELVVSVVGRDSTQRKNHYSQEKPVAGNTKLIVLVDEGSASAAEIVAGAIQDHDRGVILGTHSFGKGLVQTVIPLSFNTSLKITTGRYFTPSGRCIQKINYSDKNKVFDKVMTFEKKLYKTDKNRRVYSAGGILPDTVISPDSESKFIQQLLAQGMFFRFATNYYNKSFKNGDKKESAELFELFMKYLEDQGFQFNFKSEKLLKQLRKVAEENNYNIKFQNEITDLESKFNKIKNDELYKYKDEIITEIKVELKARTDGRTGRIIELLKYDKQYAAALEILKGDCSYKHFLGSCE